jgi:hypothetical protein
MATQNLADAQHIRVHAASGVEAALLVVADFFIPGGADPADAGLPCL